MNEKDQFYKRLGAEIREARYKYCGKMTQEILADLLGVWPNTVSRWETGVYKPTAFDLSKITAILGKVFN